MASHVTREIQRIYGAIYDAIVEQRLPPGTRLTELNLVEVFGANRNHIRSALRELAHLKLVRLEMNRGAFVEEPAGTGARSIRRAPDNREGPHRRSRQAHASRRPQGDSRSYRGGALIGQ